MFNDLRLLIILVFCAGRVVLSCGKFSPEKSKTVRLVQAQSYSLWSFYYILLTYASLSCEIGTLNSSLEQDKTTRWRHFFTVFSPCEGKSFYFSHKRWPNLPNRGFFPPFRQKPRHRNSFRWRSKISLLPGGSDSQSSLEAS